MTTLSSFQVTDDLTDNLASYHNRLLGGIFRSEFQNVESLSGTKTLTDTDTAIQRLNCNGASRTVKAPTANTTTNHPFFIVNSTSSGTYTLTVQNNGATVTYAVLNPSEFILLMPDGNGAYLPFGNQFWNVVSPTQITANQNDYNPSGASSANALRLSTDASRDITGFAFPAAYKTVLVHNVGSFNIVLKDESASSTAANRFALNGDATISADQSVLLWYDATSSRWRLVGGGSSSTTTSSGGDAVRTKYIITPSIATNDITIALKYIDGNDATTTNKITFRVGNTEYDLTAAMSFTKTDGTNWCNAGASELAAKNVQFFMYAIGETGGSAGLKFGFSRIPYAKTMGDFVNTTTSEKYIAGNWTNFNSTDAVTNIGRFQAQLSASAAFNWSIPTANVINHPIDETDILTWQPTYSATGSMTYTSVTTSIAEYRVKGRTFYCDLISIGTTGGTAAQGIRATLPFSVRNYAVNIPSVGWTADGGGTIAACMFVDATTANLLACRRYDAANYALGTNRYIALNSSFAL